MNQRLRYDQCLPGLRIVHETGGAGRIVGPTGGLIRIRLDAMEHDTLAIPPQLFLDLKAEERRVAVHSTPVRPNAVWSRCGLPSDRACFRSFRHRCTSTAERIRRRADDRGSGERLRSARTPATSCRLTSSLARILQAGQTGKKALGTLMIALAGIMITGLDRPLEAVLVNASPGWLTELTTRF